MALSPPRSKLFEAHANSAAVWQADLKKLFHHSKERYADVMWEVSDGDDAPVEEVFGHKGALHARPRRILPLRLFSSSGFAR